ncbi:MAG: FixH family protein [Oceanicaulis sp.]
MKAENSTGDWNDVHEGESTFRIKGWHVLAGMVAFFGVIFTVNAIFITVALDTFPGEETRRSYVQGLAYNDVIAEREAQAALGWSAAANLTPTQVLVAVTDADGAPVANLQFTGTLQHPANMQLDRTLAFEELRPGVYGADTQGLEEGLWTLSAEAEGDTRFALERELWRR